MKRLLFGIITLTAITLNAQNMEGPEQTVVSLFIATDEREWDQVAQCFHQKVLLDYSSLNGQAAVELSPLQIIDTWKTILPGFDHTQHQLSNFQSSQTDDSAKVFCYGTASHYLKSDAGNLWIVVGTYNFDLQKVDAGLWKISHMEFNFKYQDGNLNLAEEAINKIK